jgi:transposase InsO family protein
MILRLLDEAHSGGARLSKSCEVIGVSPRMVERWKGSGSLEDGRKGPKEKPANKLNELERRRILKVVNSPEYRDLSPKQIVPNLVDKGIYLASESTIYRILREEGQMNHRERSRPATHSRPKEHEATGPNQVWSWDITYLPSAVRGIFYYLYLVMDVWSRKIVGFEVHPLESMELSAEMITRICEEYGIDRDQLVLHSDNGGPMKGATMLLTLQKLGVMPSFSRPQVSDDNPYSEALFRTLKYRPEYPGKPFGSLEDAITWVTGFVTWYNTEHLHSSIMFVTPDDRHFGRSEEILAKRKEVYEQAKRKNPSRWSRQTRNWDPVESVVLNPKSGSKKEAA